MVNAEKGKDAAIAKVYGRISKIYVLIEATFQRRLRRQSLRLLDASDGETVLEIGPGTGAALAEMAKSVGEGKVCGLDITPEMVRQARDRLGKTDNTGKVHVVIGDARKIPFFGKAADAVYMAETLELFAREDMRTVLQEIRRVLKPGGRLVVVSMSRKNHEGSIILRIYEMLHRKFPFYINCRPIYVEDVLRDAGFNVAVSRDGKIAGLLPVKMILAGL